MSAVELKIQLHELIDKVNDRSVLKAIRTILTKAPLEKTMDWWDELPTEIQEVLEKSIEPQTMGMCFPTRT